MKRLLIVVLAFTFITLATSSTVGAQTRTLFWERWDVTIKQIDTDDNSFVVFEDYVVRFTGTFSFGTAEIPYTNLTSITDVQVIDQGRALTASCNGNRGTFCARVSNNAMQIQYYFTEPVSNAQRTIRLQYRVNGALRIYPGGDQLYWAAIPPEHFGFSIGSSVITVELPPGFAPREGIDPIVTEGAPSEITVNGSTVRAVATRSIGGNENFEIRVQYPHDPDAEPPPWQAAYDTQREYEDNVQPLVDIGVIGLSTLIGLGGILGAFIRYRTAGRDPEVGPVPEYLAEPPSDLSPAVVGTLLDETADLRDVMSIIFHLAHRGYLTIEESQTQGLFGIGFNRQFTFKRTDKPLDDLRPFERRFMDSVFTGGTTTRTLESMRNVFYMTIARIQQDLYSELVTLGMYAKNPNSVKGQWAALGVVLMVFAAAGFFVLFSIAETMSMTLLCLPASLGLVGLVIAVMSPAMPAKSRKGAEEAAKWRAFLTYLQKIDQYTLDDNPNAEFERYLPYTVAFGIDRTWVNRFKQVPAVEVPPWYVPTYGRRVYRTGTPIYGGGGMGEAAGGGVDFGDVVRNDGGNALDDMAGDISGGLEDISSGLSSMLESASRVMSSRPQSASGSGSWSSGGRSWSGGGFGGGGSSGGGSRGFG